jgi:hypothetical protein
MLQDVSLIFTVCVDKEERGMFMKEMTPIIQKTFSTAYYLSPL